MRRTVRIDRIINAALLIYSYNIFFPLAPVTAQETESAKTTINELRAPRSPAFKLLGVGESDITPATSPKAFGLNLLESISNSKFPSNVSVEFAPYWWFDQSELTLDKYYSRTGFGESILQTASFSIATTQSPESLDSTRLGVGARFNLISGQPHPTIAKLIESARTGNTNQSAKVLKDLGFAENLQLCETPPTLNNNAVEKFKKCISENQNYGNIAKALNKLDLQRVGFQLEFASAVGFDFLDNDFNDSELSKVGVWLTPSYVPASSDFSFLGIVRYEHDSFGDKDDNTFDLGSRIIWQPKESNVSVSMEYLRRFGDLADDRIVGVFEYDINDTYSVFASYGKTFETAFKGNDDLVTLFGINIGLGKERVVPVVDLSRQ
jgi:hypothetical protein